MSNENMPIMDLENKILANTDTDITDENRHFVKIYSSISFLDIDSLCDYIQDCIFDESEEHEEIKLHEVSSIARFIDDIYVIASSERIAELAKEWLEDAYPNKKVFIAEDENGIPNPELEINQEPVSISNNIDPSLVNDFTNDIYLVIANFPEYKENGSADKRGVEFLETHRTIQIATYEKDNELPKNIAIIIGNPSLAYNIIIEDLKKINFSNTTLLINLNIYTNHPELFIQAQAYLDNYIHKRYGLYGIEAKANIIQRAYGENNTLESDVEFDIDIQSNIPTTIIHSDILAFISSYCLNIEFNHNRKK